VFLPSIAPSIFRANYDQQKAGKESHQSRKCIPTPGISVQKCACIALGL
jgi:hypothetical protein